MSDKAKLARLAKVAQAMADGKTVWYECHSGEMIRAYEHSVFRANVDHYLIEGEDIPPRPTQEGCDRESVDLTGECRKPIEKSWVRGDYLNRGLGHWFSMGVNHIRIAAKHADVFDPARMDFETWARAAIGRGMVLRGECHDGSCGYFNQISKDRVSGMSLSHSQDSWTIECPWNRVSWTAITRAEYERETAPPKPATVPWSCETFPLNNPVWVRMKAPHDIGCAYLITACTAAECYIQSAGWQSWRELHDEWEQHDGTVCGVAQ